MHARARVVVVVSFVLMSVMGAGFILAYWANQSVARAAYRSLLYLVIIGCVHLAGYLLYVQQFQAAASAPVSRRISSGISDKYWPALKQGLLLQIIFGVLSALILVAGDPFMLFAVALLGHWMGILMIVLRRPTSPTAVDLFFVRYGIVLLMIATVLVAPSVWSIIGESHLNGLERLFGE